MSYLKNTTDRPVVAISLGDYNGIGPEIILKTFSDPRILKICVPVIYGSFKIFSRYKKILNLTEDLFFFQIKGINQLNPKKVNLINVWDEDPEVSPGKSSEEAGKYSFLALKKAVQDVNSGLVDGLVTAPINKFNIKNDNFNFAGHTEYLTKEAGAKESLMMMVSDLMRVGLVTSHIPLAEVKKHCTKENILKKYKILYKSLVEDFAISKPKIAILGLNPHAGENGVIGNEENEIIFPLIEELRASGKIVYGPFPSDGFFGMHQYKKFDGILAMYHDQGLIPFKTLAFDSGINFTAGLPFIRTSPDHGTAYDIAGKNNASESSFREALFLACDLIKVRKKDNL